ncbi:MAG: hypothetical protein QHI38_05835 [Armatimonadota bacterium]|nr:hypothetical protein [Armatimonadota bacterium]
MNTLTVFIIAVTTSRMIFPGVPPVLPAPDAPKLTSPPAARTISFDLFSGAKATYLSKVEVQVPEGLKVANPVRLILDLERKSLSEPEQQASSSKFVVKQYWGSAEEVPAGQPRVYMSDQLPVVESPRSLPDTSYAYWPASTAEPLAEDASAVGTYVLTSDYCGRAQITLDSLYDFLAPIDLVGTPRKADLDKPVKITWKSVPRALGYLVTAVGGSSAESITWTSSSDPALAETLEHRPWTREEIADLIEKKVLLPSYCVSCTIPAGIFKGSSSVFVSIMAFGPDKIEKQDGFETWVIVRSKAGIPIFGTNYKPMIEDENKKGPAG